MLVKNKLDLASRHNNLSEMFRQKIEIFRTTRAVEGSIDELISKTTKQVYNNTCTYTCIYSLLKTHVQGYIYIYRKKDGPCI